MNWRMVLILSLCVGFVFPTYTLAVDESKANWRLGRIYYRMVCTDCHKQMAEPISPVSKTIAEWKAYFNADRHDSSGRTNSSLKYYVSREYRESIRAKNKAANKFIDIPDQQLLVNVRAFVVHGAKDSDTPASCQ